MDFFNELEYYQYIEHELFDLVEKKLIETRDVDATKVWLETEADENDICRYISGMDRWSIVEPSEEIIPF